VEKITIQNSHLDSLSELLLCDTLYKAFDDAGSVHVWPCVKSLNISNNVIKNVSDIGNLVPALRHIDLSYNQLCTVFNVTSLPYLESVSYAGNVISYVTNLHLRFGNIKTLDLSQNQIEHLDAFFKLYSLVELNLSCNRIACVEQVRHLADLPCLEVLILTGNPVASSVDYRVRSLSYFGPRANDVSLDNEKASLTEMDQISILQAIEVARQSMLS
jgi:Leucine-rich repeat (LRR) protein